MKNKDLEKLMGTLPEIDTLEGPAKPRAWIDEGAIRVSAENGDGAADYYDGAGGYPHINSKLEKWASANGGFWEWVNPGAIAFYGD